MTVPRYAERIVEAAGSYIACYFKKYALSAIAVAMHVNGLLRLARELGLGITEVARCNSGDITGERTRFVGYAAFALHQRTS